MAPPIGDFALEVGSDPAEGVSFCWDGPLETPAPGRVRTSAKDFVPGRELTLYFLSPF
jgi:hypothetical protein